MDIVLIQLLTGLAGASTLFLVAAGLTVVFGVTRVVNFSHGSLFMLGAFIGWSILSRLPREPESAFTKPFVKPLATMFTVPSDYSFHDPVCKGVDFICWPTVGASTWLGFPRWSMRT